MPAFSSRSVLGLAPTYLKSSALRIFKQALSNESLRYRSTSHSLAGFLCPFFTLGPLPEKKDCKRFFDTTYINSRPLAGNHATKKVDLNFGESVICVPVRLNRSWQLELLNYKPVCIMEVISLTAALFWVPLFAPCPCHTLNLASKLGLKTRIIASEVVNKRIKVVRANRTIRQLN